MVGEGKEEQASQRMPPQGHCSEPEELEPYPKSGAPRALSRLDGDLNLYYPVTIANSFSRPLEWPSQVSVFYRGSADAGYHGRGRLKASDAMKSKQGPIVLPRTPRTVAHAIQSKHDPLECLAPSSGACAAFPLPTYEHISC